MVVLDISSIRGLTVYALKQMLIYQVVVLIEL